MAVAAESADVKSTGIPPRGGIARSVLATATRGAVLVILVFLIGCRPRPEPPLPSSIDGNIVDLTHPFDENTIFWPTEDGFQFEHGTAGYTEAGFYYEAHRFCTAEHGGTHVDAPVHFFEGGHSVEQIPLERLVGPAVVVDVTDSASVNRDYQITRADLEAFEAREGRRLDDVIVLLHTGFGARWPDRESYMGTDLRGDAAVAELSFPGLHPDAARWLVENRSIRAVGLDTPSIDYGRSTQFESHQILFEQNIPAFENVANLDQLPEHNFTIIALPMKIAGGSGAPLRIVAVVP